MLVNIEEHSKKCTLRCILNRRFSQYSTLEKNSVYYCRLHGNSLTIYIYIYIYTYIDTNLIKCGHKP